MAIKPTTMKKTFTLSSVMLCGLYFIFFLQSCKQPDNKLTPPESGILVRDEYWCVPEIQDKAWYTSGKKAPLFSGLEGINFPITTKSAEARQYFNQGLMLSYGFNHAEAARSFYEACKIDSTCAMAWWGFAYVLGPNYNAGMETDNFQRAYDAAQKAKKLSSSCTRKEKDLIEALTYRYSKDDKASRPVLDSIYASKMRSVFKKHSDDADVAALFAESLMDLHPWNLFKKDGTPQPWTPEIIGVLEHAVQKNPSHAGAHHFYVHAVEMSQHAGKAQKSADLLRNLVPGSGHLLHMPSHTDIRTGNYHQGVLANINAVMVDSLYTEACHAQGAYPLAYYPHNYHFLAACATLCGESKNALLGANQTMLHANKKLMQDPAWATLQHYATIPLYVQVKLGLWKDIQNTPEPEMALKYPRVIWHYARGMAALSQDKTSKAKKELKAMQEILQDTTMKQLTIWYINNLYDISMIALNTLEGEIYAKERNYSMAIKALKEAIAFEDALNYNEPPDWFFSTRHNLGAVLIEAADFREAVKVYEEDLKTYPENGWALIGLMNAYEKLGEEIKHNETRDRFNRAWNHADIRISTSRIL
jgi:tetratricopeptide (TPR) repeat protein